jgi:putative ATP-dependent endonuclease of OLD family
MKVTALRIENFRTLESINLGFDSSYTAICGANDSGKTNVVRALRCLLREEAPAYSPFWESQELSGKHDWPKWRTDEAGVISVAATLELDRVKDAGLFQFVLTQLKENLDGDTMLLTVVSVYDRGSDGRGVAVTLGEKEFGGIEAQYVLEKLQSSRTVFFHNSTSAILTQPFSRHLGRLRELSADVEDVAKIETAVAKGLKKIAKGRQDDLEELLGRLGSKYRVALSLPNLDINEMPFNVTLEESKAAVPLDDWGSGTRNRTLILFLLFAAKRAQEMAASAEKVTPIIVIEEPECFLHPVAQAEFGRLLQDLASEFGVQIIVTTHSPYMLSTSKPASNILLDRRVHYRKRMETRRVETGGEHWMEPFARALGLHSSEFEPWKDLFQTQAGNVVLVEGEIDKKYLELLRKAAHGAKALQIDGEIATYDGTGQLNNTVLLRLIRNRCRRLLVTYDLDAEAAVAPKLEAAGLQRDVDFFSIGIDGPGKRCVEGLLPESVRKAVHDKYPDLLAALQSEDGKERRSAKSSLKAAYFEEFERSAQPQTDDYKGFYALGRKISQAFNRAC